MPLRLSRLARMMREKGEWERAAGSAGSSCGVGVTPGLAGFAPMEVAGLSKEGPSWLWQCAVAS
eukprot:8101211-Heterocapsa_arctica.AAC.1